MPFVLRTSNFVLRKPYSGPPQRSKLPLIPLSQTKNQLKKVAFFVKLPASTPVSSRPMQIKDYFSLLELETSASVPEIKKAYRKLALLLHPDKTGSDPYAAARFAEIKEAYEVLTDPAKKEYYLQQRWYNQAAGIRRTDVTVTPVSMIQQSLDLERYVARLDEFRMDREGLLAFMLDLYSDERLEKLRAFNDPESNHTIVQSVIRSSKLLHPDQAEKVATQILKLAPGDTLIARQLAVLLQQSKRKKNREKYSVLMVLLLTALICVLIYLTSR